jgi:hypothetical protein
MDGNSARVRRPASNILRVRELGEFGWTESSCGRSCFGVVYCDSISSVLTGLLHNGSASNIHTLNFAKNAKFRIGHPATKAREITKSKDPTLAKLLPGIGVLRLRDDFTS